MIFGINYLKDAGECTALIAQRTSTSQQQGRTHHSTRRQYYTEDQWTAYKQVLQRQKDIHKLGGVFKTHLTPAEKYYVELGLDKGNNMSFNTLRLLYRLDDNGDICYRAKPSAKLLLVLINGGMYHEVVRSTLHEDFQGEAPSFEVLCRAMNTKYIFDEHFLECLFSVDPVGVISTVDTLPANSTAAKSNSTVETVGDDDDEATADATAMPTSTTTKSSTSQHWRPSTATIFGRPTSSNLAIEDGWDGHPTFEGGPRGGEGAIVHHMPISDSAFLAAQHAQAQHAQAKAAEARENNQFQQNAMMNNLLERNKRYYSWKTSGSPIKRQAMKLSWLSCGHNWSRSNQPPQARKTKMLPKFL